ncbi:MAG: N-acetyl-gamma-glutamyl-phosphate reductase [Burkholderia sp.]|nr:N-acetyl-gamma-glutamyl-phosphate reductase [Burkholderia sp.]
MITKVFVDGQEGTTGLKILEFLSNRKDIEILYIRESKRKDIKERRYLINASDITLLCLPTDAARESASLVWNKNTALIDASTMFRTHVDWVYGLPELNLFQRECIRKSKRVSVPGCHASAFILSIRPLVNAGIVSKSFVAHSYSITGYSGGGKSMIDNYQNNLSTEKLMSPRPYALDLMHKHLPEMAVHAGLKYPPIFIPIVGPFPRGLALTTYFTPSQLKKRITPKNVQSILAEHYEDEKFVHVSPFEVDDKHDSSFFDIQANNGTNRVDLFVFGNKDRFVTIARLDNLGKGASGAAIQCMNLIIGVSEDLGLKN